MLLFGLLEGGSGVGFKNVMRGSKGCLSGGAVRGYFCLKVHSQSGICERCLYSGLGNHLFYPGIPRILVQKWLKTANIHSESDCPHNKTLKPEVNVFE